MGGFALADLAIAVSKAGGLGFVGADGDLANLKTELLKVEQALDRHNGLLPIGVGVLAFAMNMQDTLDVIQRLPSIVWLFAAHDIDDYTAWAENIRGISTTSQGIDAGGHGYERGAGIISLLPEVLDALSEDGTDHIPLVAAGGIADGRAAAAALMLGAQGIVMGTRFLSASETNIHPEYRRTVLAAQDGGQCTVRSKLFDELRGPNVWPELYDGRSFRQQSFEDHAEGVPIDEIRKRHSGAIKDESRGFAQNLSGRAAAWAGTGVGLVRREESAEDIVKSVRSGIIAALDAAKARM